VQYNLNCIESAQLSSLATERGYWFLITAFVFMLIILGLQKFRFLIGVVLQVVYQFHQFTATVLKEYFMTYSLL